MELTRLKLAMVVRNFSAAGGLELYTHKLVEGLLSRGLHLTVVCARHDSTFVHENLNVVTFEASGAGSKSRRLLDEYKSANRALAQLTGIDLVHSQHQPVEHADAVTFHNHTTLRLSRVGMQWEVRLNNFKSRFIPAYQLRNQYDSLLFGNAKCCIYTSGACRDDFVSVYGGNKPDVNSRQFVAYPGADLEEVCDEGAYAPGSSNPLVLRTFLFVGRGYRKKGLDVLLAACVGLKAQGKPFHLLVAGIENALANQLRLRIRGISDYVTFLGFQKDMEGVYRRASFVILPSRVEPFGMAVIQAMRYGLVPIVSRVSGVSEVLADGEDALILQDHLNGDELAGHMLRVLSDRSLAARLSKKARATARNLSWEQTVDSTLNAYRFALDSRISAPEERLVKKEEAVESG